LAKCWTALLFLLLILRAGADPPRFTVESVQFPTVIRKLYPNDAQVPITGKLYLPSQQAGPLSVMVIMHSSSGIQTFREIYYAEQMVKAGVAALVVDSYTPRNTKTTYQDQSLVYRSQVAGDALGALKRLSSDPRFDSARIGVMGVSKGGNASFDTALLTQRGDFPTHVQFALHIPIGASCNSKFRNLKSTGKPILMMVGEKDDLVAPEDCPEYVEEIIKAGHKKISLRIFKDAPHAWENTSKPHRLNTVQNHAACKLINEDDGRIFVVKEKKWMNGEEFANWKLTNCMTLGAQGGGGTEELKALATKEILEFLKANGFLTRERTQPNASRPKSVYISR
jgi:dienelactone hydrolase